MRSVAALLGAAAWAGLAEGAKSTGPAIVTSFTAPVVTGWGGNFSNASGKTNSYMVYDAASRRWRISTKMAMKFYGPDAVINQDNFGLEKYTLTVWNGQCTNASTFFQPPTMTQGFGGFLEWAKDAVPAGHKVVSGRKCKNWRHVESNRSVCLIGDEPVYLEDHINFTGKVQSFSVEFLQPFVRQANASELELPSECVEPPAVCGTDEVKKMMIYLLHPKGKFNISDQDVADPKGDAVYICSERLWQTEDYGVATVYEISILQKFGQYLNCNFYDPPYCVGNEHFYVGREAPAGMGRNSSQCEDPDGWIAKLGTWYSMPAGGRCLESSQEIGKHCTWRIERRVKTFDLGCLFDEQHDFLGHCHNATAPFEGITDAFLRAFNSEDPAQGGCPSIPGPNSDGVDADGPVLVV